MRKISLNFISASSYGFWSLNRDAYLVRQLSDGLYGIIYMDSITPYMITASEIFLETNSDTSVRRFVYKEVGNTQLNRIAIAPDLDLSMGYG